MLMSGLARHQVLKFVSCDLLLCPVTMRLVVVFLSPDDRTSIIN